MWPIAKKVLAIGALCLAGMSSRAYAGSTVMETKIPFPFVVSGKTMPAGQYAIERDDDMSGALIIRGEHGVNAAAILNTRPAEPVHGGSHPALEFRHVENQYVLSNVWTRDGLDRVVR